ncbi:MAG TPA: nucleotidyltransferase family protein [Terracidiphilus sp.]|jgi:NDP-sugar pyrophosphorylase family protein
MVLAAGLGTRLRPLTNDRPKALVEVGGRTMLELVLERLRAFGVRDVIVNVHHYADAVVDYLRVHQNFGIRIEVSREDELLDTGGGLKKAAWFFLEGGSQEPFLLHNVDVLSTIDLGRMIAWHNQHDALATLAVQDRPTSRCLLFDDEGKLCGREAGRDGAQEFARECAAPRPLAFSGIHVISPRLLALMKEEGAFSIIATYLRLAGDGEKVMGFRADEYRWRDLGRPEHVAEASREIAEGTYPAK